MVYELVAEAVGAKRCCFQPSVNRGSVVKDRERCWHVIALIVRQEGKIFCKGLLPGRTAIARHGGQLREQGSGIRKSLLVEVRGSPVSRSRPGAAARKKAKARA
jgi:hypothetical protein